MLADAPKRAAPWTPCFSLSKLVGLRRALARTMRGQLWLSRSRSLAMRERESRLFEEGPTHPRGRRGERQGDCRKEPRIDRAVGEERDHRLDWPSVEIIP